MEGFCPKKGGNDIWIFHLRKVEMNHESFGVILPHLAQWLYNMITIVSQPSVG